MKIAMFTNTYLPQLGGVARAVNTLAEGCIRRGHEVRIIAPEFRGAREQPGVLRVPAIQNFNGSDFSVQIPVPNIISQFVDAFEPDLIHSHHPFLLGDAALREAWKARVPIVFTHHTLYECYTHYVPLDSPALKRVAIQLATEYCNLCDQIIAPSESVAVLLQKRGVKTPIRAIPTGVDLEFFASGDGGWFREAHGIARDARVISHIGRLAREKNLPYLVAAVAQCLDAHPDAVFLLVGEGSAKDEILAMLAPQTAAGQLRVSEKLAGAELAAAYAASDWFVFASQSETQGLVLAEAMAAGKPVVALDGPGVREIVRDGENGILLECHTSPAGFAAAVGRLMDEPGLSARYAVAARATAAQFGVEQCVGRVLDSYAELSERRPRDGQPDPMPWDRLLAGIEIEWNLLVEKMAAAAAAVVEHPVEEEAGLD